MMTSLFIYLVVANVVERQVSREVSDGVFFIFIGISVVLFFMIRIVNAAMLGSGGERTGPAAAENPAAIQKLQAAAMVTFALCEVPAVIGLVLYFIGGNMTNFYLFLMISLFCFAAYFPRFSQWEEWYRKQQPGQGMKRP
jgi:F0F1-type ATP synthase membrane subunit c/vacuolar-type H+-ATPase subunit K